MRYILMLILILVMTASTFFTVGNIVGEVPKPAVPEFTVKILAYPYDVPTTYSTDPYTGETITHDGYHVENRSIQVSVKNQAYSCSNGSTFEVYFNVRTKPHFGEDWTELFPTKNWPVDPVQYALYIDGSPKQSSTDYTIISIPLDNYPVKSQVDFQVEAMVGHSALTFVANHPTAPTFGGEYYQAIAYDTSSGWSSTQTLTVSDETATPTALPSPSLTTAIPSGYASHDPTPASTANQPISSGSILFGLDLTEIVIAVLLGVTVVLLVFVVFYLRRRSVAAAHSHVL